MASAGSALAVCGALGFAYGLLVIRHARRQTDYQMVLEDWIWFCSLPLVGYATLFGAAVTLQWHAAASLFVIAGTSLLLLFVGIHNAWDAVTYIAIDRRQQQREASEEKPRRPAKPRR